MMRIFILTFHESPNYGALLQAYALQKYLRDSGNEAMLIDYRNAARKYSQVHGLRKIRSVLWSNTVKPLFESKVRLDRTKRFKDLFFRYSEKAYHSEAELRADPPIADVYITGSDQVWNSRNNNGDLSYFLDFVPAGKKRISYAPSFGTGKQSDEYLERIKPHIKEIDFLSVREASGAKILKEKCGCDALVVCDPVFLLSKEEWNMIAETPEQGDYILCYYMPGDKLIEKRIKQVAEKLRRRTGYRIVNIGKKDYDKLRFWEPNKYDYGPLEFVGAIANAAYVVTNSFHGSAFSVLFEKNLYVPVRYDLAAEKTLNTRIVEMLRVAGREDALSDSCADIAEADIQDNARPADKRFENYIAFSKEFLHKSISRSSF